MIVFTWRHEILQDFRNGDASLGLIQLQQDTNDTRSGAHGRVQHVHIFGLEMNPTEPLVSVH